MIANLPPLKCVKDIRSFLGHAGFYRRFIKDFSKIAKPLCKFLAKEAIFQLDDAWLEAFDTLKKALISAQVLQPPNWKQPFEVMCDASNFAVGAVFRSKKGRQT